MWVFLFFLAFVRVRDAAYRIIVSPFLNKANDISENKYFFVSVEFREYLDYCVESGEWSILTVD